MKPLPSSADPCDAKATPNQLQSIQELATDPLREPLPPAEVTHSPSWRRCLAALAATVLTAGFGVQSLAGIPEPGVRLYGTILLNGAPVSASDTGVVVEARKSPNGPAISSYRMGSRPAAGNFFSLTLNAESATPLTNPTNVLVGSTFHLVVRDASGDREIKPFTLSERGLSTRIDFGSADSDGDGMSDSFELSFFGSGTGGNPAEDSDLDGRPNLREFLQGTNPRIPDGRHPADLSPADNRLSQAEVNDYILAWRTSGNWPVEPSLTADKVEDYVTRAAALWKGGEAYVFVNEPVTTAPLWWVQATNAVPGAGTLTVRRVLPSSYLPNQSVVVTVELSPGSSTRAFALVESPPEGWSVRNLSHEGRWDPTSRKIKWGPFFDATPRTLSYEAVPTPAATGSASFIGRGSFDGLGVPAAGPFQIWPPGQNAAPTLKAVAGATGTSLELQGEPGRTYLLRSSKDLVDWTGGEPVTLDTNGFARLPIAGDAIARFYKLRSSE